RDAQHQHPDLGRRGARDRSARPVVLVVVVAPPLLAPPVVIVIIVVVVVTAPAATTGAVVVVVVIVVPPPLPRPVVVVIVVLARGHPLGRLLRLVLGRCDAGLQGGQFTGRGRAGGAGCGAGGRGAGRGGRRGVLDHLECRLLSGRLEDGLALRTPDGPGGTLGHTEVRGAFRAGDERHRRASGRDKRPHDKRPCRAFAPRALFLYSCR